MIVVIGIVSFCIGVAVGLLWYGWIIAFSLSHGRLPKSLENVGFILPGRYKKYGNTKQEIKLDEGESKSGKCPKFATCYKMEILRDKDYAGDRRYLKAVNDVCAKCGNK